MKLNKSEITNVSTAKQATSLFTQLYQGILLQMLATSLTRNRIDLSILPSTQESLTDEAREHLTALESRVERLIRFAAMMSMTALRELGLGHRHIAEHFANGSALSLDRQNTKRDYAKSAYKPQHYHGTGSPAGLGFAYDTTRAS